MSEETVRWRVLFSGKVQHVGFRYTAYYLARELYLTGWVDNLPDGRVAMEAQGGKYLKDCALYVTVEPCPMCAAAMNWAQMGRIVYGADDPKRGYSLFTPSLLHPKTEVQKSVLEAECSEPVSNFFKTKR